MKKFVKFLLIVLITIALILVTFILFNSLDPVFLNKGNALTNDEMETLLNQSGIDLLYNSQLVFLGRTEIESRKVFVIKLINTENNEISLFYIEEKTGIIVKQMKNSGFFNTYVEIQ